MLGQKSFQDKRYSRYKVLQGHRAKVNLFQMLLKDSGQRLLEVKGSSRSSVEDTRQENPQDQRLLEVQGQMFLNGKSSSQSHDKSYSRIKVTSGHRTGYYR